MKLIALVSSEWWTGCSVLDRSNGPIRESAEYIEHRDWYAARGVRRKLLAGLEHRE